MRALRIAAIALIGVVSLQVGARAQQNLTFGLFERSLEQLRQESGIPGLSAVIVQSGEVVWEAGFGMADAERSVRATPDTPYAVGDLTQILAATLVLQRVQQGHLDLAAPMHNWTTAIPEVNATVHQVLQHTSSGTFRYEPPRFAALTPVIEASGEPFKRVLADDLLDVLAMQDSVPGRDLTGDEALFDARHMERYARVIRDLAVPYRVDARRRVVRSVYPPGAITAGTGLVSTARDLAKFDLALRDDLLLNDAMRTLMWAPAGASPSRPPTGLGWFVQFHNDEKVVWHFGLLPNASSSLLLKVPERDLTLILLANSDGLTAPFGLGAGDVTTSLFARLFLRLFLP